MASIIGENTRTDGPQTLERYGYSRANPGSAPLSEPNSNKTVPTTVYVRHGRLVHFKDRNPNREEAHRLLGTEADRVREAPDDYRESIASALKVDVSNVKRLEDRPRLVWEDKALVLDYPLLRISGGEKVVEMRICIAVCTAKASTKVWARVNMPLNDAKQPVRVGMDEVRDLLEHSRPIANTSVKWGYERFRRILSGGLPASRVTVKADVRATSLGIWDSKLKEPFERLSQAGVTAAHVLNNGSGLDDRLTLYCQEISDIAESNRLSWYTQKPMINKVAWFKMPLYATLGDGEVVPRVVLYLMRDIKRHVEIVGLAYDDSERGDIAIRSGAVLSKVVGRWI